MTENYEEEKILENKDQQENKKPKRIRPTVPKWESAAKDQVKQAIKKFQRPLIDLQERDANEGDTRLVVTDLLCYGLGYDKYEDLTTEYQVKGEFADYGVRIDKQLVAFIEVKRVAQKLNTKHLRQVQSYAVNEGVEWMVLTNGHIWQAYHLTGTLPVVVDLAFEVNLLDETTVNAKTNKLFYLHKESLKRRQIDDLWKRAAATSPEALQELILSDSILDALRREVKKQSNIITSNEALQKVLQEEIFK